MIANEANEPRRVLTSPLAVSVNPGQPFIDITAPKFGVQVEHDADKDTLWIHVDGITVVRISRLVPGQLELP